MATKSSYYELLKHPNWQRKRLEIMEAAGFKCELCGSDERTLNVHHSYYEKGCAPWEYPNESLHCLCEDCHAQSQEKMKQLHRAIGMLPLVEMEMVTGFILGMDITFSRREEICTEGYGNEFFQGMSRAVGLRVGELIDLDKDGFLDVDEVMERFLDGIRRG